MAGRRGHTLQANAGDRDKTLSCSCLVSKRKNFVSRARTTPLRSVVLPAWGWKSSSACCARQHRPRALAGCSPGSWGARPHGSHAARQHTETGQEAGRQQKQRVSTDLPKKEEHWKSLPRPVAFVAAPSVGAGRRRHPAGKPTALAAARLPAPPAKETPTRSGNAPMGFEGLLALSFLGRELFGSPLLLSVCWRRDASAGSPAGVFADPTPAARGYPDNLCPTYPAC
jgi:hypothetical protein